MKAWYRGSIMPAEACRLPVLDHGLLYGDGVFEGIRITAGKVFRLEKHLERLARSARAIGLELPHSLTDIATIVCSTASAFDQDEAYVRLLVTRGVGELTLDPRSCDEPELVCIVAGIRMFPADVRTRGLRLATSPWRRPAMDVLDPQVKSLNYLNNVLAKRDAGLKGYDEAVLLNANGRIAEASAANLFAVIDGILVTPACSEGALPGITRSSLLECWRDFGETALERTLSRYELLDAQEAFLCGSGAGLMPIGSLDDTAIGHAERPVLDRLSAAFTAYSRKHGTSFRDP